MTEKMIKKIYSDGKQEIASWKIGNVRSFLVTEGTWLHVLINSFNSHKFSQIMKRLEQATVVITNEENHCLKPSQIFLAK